MTSRVLCLLADGFEEIEAVTPIDLLRRAGVEVVVAGLDDEQVTGRSGLVLLADATLDEVDAFEYDVLLIPGGPGVAGLRADGRAAELATEFANDQKLIAAICAAPLVLKDAGLLEGKRFTAHFSAKEELPGASDERVVADGNFITSRGAGTALDFGLALVERLCGKDKRDEIAEAVMV